MAGKGSHELDVGLGEGADVAEALADDEQPEIVGSSPRSGPTMASSSPRERRKASKAGLEWRRVSSVAEPTDASAANAAASANRSSGCMSSSPSAPLTLRRGRSSSDAGRSRISAYRRAAAGGPRRAAAPPRGRTPARPAWRASTRRGTRRARAAHAAPCSRERRRRSKARKTSKKTEAGRTWRSSTTARPRQAVASAPSVEGDERPAELRRWRRSSAIAITVETSRMPTTCATAQATRMITDRWKVGVGRRGERSEDQQGDATAERQLGEVEAELGGAGAAGPRAG